MSTLPVPAPQDDAQALREERRKARQLKAAACRDRLRTATDALAAADLLLGLAWSVRECGSEGKR